MHRRLRFSGLLLVGLLAGTPGTAAQDGDYSFVKGVQPGQYSDLNIWRTLKLGTAPYVNPKLAKRAATAYKYDPQAWDESAKEKILALAKEGEAGVGTEVGKDIIVSNDPEKIEAALKHNEPGTVFVTSKPTDGLGKGDAIVTWGLDYGTAQIKE